MTALGWFQIIGFMVIIAASMKPMGTYMHKVFTGQRTLLTPVFGGLEKLVYRASGVNPDEEMKWTTYTAAMLIFSAVTLIVTYAVLRLQAYLPFNPEKIGSDAPVSWHTAMTPDLAFNTAASFTTNTNWQSYGGENAMSYFAQMVGLVSHNFFSAAVGIAVAVALVRALAHNNTSGGHKVAIGIGNFWADLTRATLYVLLPISIIVAIFYVQQGMPQNFHGYARAHTIEGAVQIIPGGAIASQEAIKNLGTNGGGPYNANSAHPFENPNPLTNYVEMITIFLLGAGLVYMFGIYVGNVKQGWAIFGAMAGMWLIGVSVAYTQEAKGNPILNGSGIVQSASKLGDSGGNFEGKEVRFGQAQSMLFTTVTTDASCGAVNNMHDSLTPIAGLVPMANIMMDEVIFGGVGSGLYGILMYAVIAVFIAGLMVGRTPEYLGKKIESFEIKMAMLAMLILCADVLCFSGVMSYVHVPHPATYWNTVSGTPPSVNALANANTNNSGPHGFSEILYAFDSCTGNNGSAFAGLSTNTPFWNLMLGLSMLVGRFLMMVPLLALAGSMAKKQRVVASAGTFPTDNVLFAGLLAGIIIIVGALQYFPAVSLGPVVEHFLIHAGKTF